MAQAKSPRPGSKTTESLLGIGTTEIAVIGVKDRLMGCSPPFIISVSSLSIEYRILCCGNGMLNGTAQQRNLSVVFVQHAML